MSITGQEEEEEQEIFDKGKPTEYMDDGRGCSIPTKLYDEIMAMDNNCILQRSIYSIDEYLHLKEAKRIPFFGLPKDYRLLDVDFNILPSMKIEERGKYVGVYTYFNKY